MMEIITLGTPSPDPFRVWTNLADAPRSGLYRTRPYAPGSRCSWSTS